MADRESYVIQLQNILGGQEFHGVKLHVRDMRRFSDLVIDAKDLTDQQLMQLYHLIYDLNGIMEQLTVQAGIVEVPLEHLSAIGFQTDGTRARAVYRANKKRRPV